MDATLYERCCSLCKEQGLDLDSIGEAQIMIIGTNILILNELKDVNDGLTRVESAVYKTN
ncbi:MAG: hypothetical protein MPJ08_08830 [Nitrosopumilus sp.]|nr:hypothetical protein [Nitrosopumilus sp.]